MGIEKEAGFLLHPKGRTVFMILLALLMFGEDTLGIVLAVILILLGIINGIVLYMYEEEYVSSYAQYDDSYASSSRDGKFSAPRLEEEGRLAGSSSRTDIAGRSILLHLQLMLMTRTRSWVR